MSQLTPEPDDTEYTAGLDTGEDEVIDLDEVVGSDNVDDVLDTSYSPPEKPLGSRNFGTTAWEERQDETIDQRLRQEEPDPALEVDDPLDDGEDLELDEQADAGREVGDVRAGRLVDPDEGAHEDVEKDLVGSDVGIDGGAASAEEAAMHVIEDGPGSDAQWLSDDLDDVDEGSTR
jgi:hypothetical protein